MPGQLRKEPGGAPGAAYGGGKRDSQTFFGEGKYSNDSPNDQIYNQGRSRMEGEQLPQEKGRQSGSQEEQSQAV